MTALAVRAPFHLEATVRVLQRRPSNRVDVWEEGRYLRVLTSAHGCALVSVENRGGIDAPDLRCSVLAGDAAAHPANAWMLHRMLGLDIDPAPFQRLALAVPTIRPTAEALRGIRPPRFATLFEAFANVVPFQQVSLDAGVAIVGRLVEHFGEPLAHEGRRFHAFPTAGTIANAPPEDLRACGLSARKADTLRMIGNAIGAGELDEARIARMSTHDALRTLRALPGIGPWSAGLVLLRGFGRLDVFPPGDVGAERSLRELTQLAPHTPLCRVVERFGDYRGFFYFFGLGAGLLNKGLIHPAPA